MTDERKEFVERIGNGRRWEDNRTCPFHKRTIADIKENKENIKAIEDDMVKKEDLVDIKKAINSKAPRWVVALMITTGVPILIALMVWIGSRLDVISKVAANQEVIMQAFDIEAVPKDFDSRKQ